MQSLFIDIKQILSGCYPPAEAGALARLILEKRFGLSMLDICMGKDSHLLPHQAKDLEDILARLRRQEPVQYILGEADFCGLTFFVNDSVLIPRPETEELVGWLLEALPQTPCRLLDVGTGSGCIAVALSHARPDCRVEAWDISEDALAVARRNNARCGTAVQFTRKDVLQMAEEEGAAKYDAVVSNPPYVTLSEKMTLDANVRCWEPEQALYVSDACPLLFYDRIARLCRTLLRPGGWLYFEINRAFGPQVVALLQGLDYHSVELKKDISGNDRMVRARL